MLGISRHTDYAARIILHLSQEGDGARVTAREIAGKRLIPPAFIRRIVSRLSFAGILTTVRGNGGGITLAREPARITLLDVVVAMEGPVGLNGCGAEPESCSQAEGCPVRGAWAGATKVLARYLASVEFAKLARSAAHRAARKRPKRGRG
jgi:Rrf2 family protein